MNKQPNPYGISLGTLAATVVGLGVVGGVGYLGWRYSKTAKTREAQAALAAQEAALGALEQQGAGSQKGKAQAEGMAKAQAEGTAKLASVTFRVKAWRSYGWTVDVQTPDTLVIPVGASRTFEAMEKTATKMMFGKPDWTVKVSLALDPTIAELVLRANLSEHTVFGNQQDVGPMIATSAAQTTSVSLGNLASLLEMIQDKEGVTFVSAQPDPDLFVSLTPVTFAYV